MKINIAFFFLLFHINSFSQSKPDTILSKLIDLGRVSNADENFDGYEKIKEKLKGVEIVMLGEQSHGEGTAFETKIKLIKYLHQEMGFDILAFESDFFGTHKTWELIKEGGDIPLLMAKGVSHYWGTAKEFKALNDYIEKTKDSDRPLVITGFDGQMIYKNSYEYFINDLIAYLKTIKCYHKNEQEIADLKNAYEMIFNFKRKKYKRKQAKRDTLFIGQLIKEINTTEKNQHSSYWVQCLKSFQLFLSDVKLGSYYRDQQMAENLKWIKEHNPDKKIICWGATSHFLYNAEQVRMKNIMLQVMAANHYKRHPMMGHYAKKEYGDRLYTIGFIAYEGQYGMTRLKKLKPAPENSLEYILNQSKFGNCFLPLGNLKIAPYYSRPLGNFYMKNDISNIMDGVIFNRRMEFPKFDRNLFLKAYPENKYIKPESEE